MHKETVNETAVFGGGCFWCTEAIFSQLKGVESVNPGYTGGTVLNPTYEQVASGVTGHVEVIKIQYNPDMVSYQDLLTVFFATHDPTVLNRQGDDVGTQYRSAVFYTTERQRKEAEEFIAILDDDHSSRIVTEVVPLAEFYPAEDYHQNYYNNHKDAPYCRIVINPKLDKLRERFGALLRT